MNRTANGKLVFDIRNSKPRPLGDRVVIEKNKKVFWSVVPFVSIVMMNLQTYGFATPRIYSTFSAFVLSTNFK